MIWTTAGRTCCDTRLTAPVNESAGAPAPDCWVVAAALVVDVAAAAGLGEAVASAVAEVVAGAVAEATGLAGAVATAGAAAVSSGGLVKLTEDKGRLVLVPGNLIGFVEIGASTERRVGFGAP